MSNLLVASTRARSGQGDSARHQIFNFAQGTSPLRTLQGHSCMHRLMKGVLFWSSLPETYPIWDTHGTRHTSCDASEASTRKEEQVANASGPNKSGEGVLCCEETSSGLNGHVRDGDLNTNEMSYRGDRKGSPERVRSESSHPADYVNTHLEGSTSQPRDERGNCLAAQGTRGSEDLFNGRRVRNGKRLLYASGCEASKHVLLWDVQSSLLCGHLVPTVPSTSSSSSLSSAVIDIRHLCLEPTNPFLDSDVKLPRSSGTAPRNPVSSSRGLFAGSGAAGVYRDRSPGSRAEKTEGGGSGGVGCEYLGWLTEGSLYIARASWSI
eukprot:Rmarinus@m.2540